MVSSPQAQPLDDVDTRLIDALAGDGRASVRTLAACIGVPESTARARLTQLLASGTVSVLAMAHPAALGQTIVFYAHVECRTAPPADLDALPALDDSPWIAQSATGPRLLVQMTSKDTDGVRRYLDLLRELDWVRAVHSSIVLALHAGPGAEGSIKAAPGAWAVDVPELDAVDLQLIRLLRANGRASYTDLAQAVDRSIASVRRRVLNLRGTGTIRFTTIIAHPLGAGFRATVALGVDARHRSGALARLTTMDGIDYVAETTGTPDILCSVAALDRDGLSDRITRTTTLDGVLSYEATPINVRRNRLRWTAGRAEEGP
ncbi:hypothetical protein GCM10027589_15400 [Actinocorallia lasiicapitis]